MRIRGAMLVLIAVVVTASSLPGSTARAAERESGIQRSPDGKRILVSKDVEGQRYAITLNTADRSLTGNVFFTDGGAPVFIACTRVSGNDFACSIAGACTSEGRESGIQTVPGGGGVLVSKDIGGQRYAITENVDGTLTGNVFFSDSGAAKFIVCQPLGNDAFSCAVADSCATASCVDEFVTLPDPVTLPSSFFAVPGTCPAYQPVTDTVSLSTDFFNPASSSLNANEKQVFGALHKTTEVTGVIGLGVEAAASANAAAASANAAAEPDTTLCPDGGSVTMSDAAVVTDCRVGDTVCSGTMSVNDGHFVPQLGCVDVEQDRSFSLSGDLTLASGSSGNAITGSVGGTQVNSSISAIAVVYDALPIAADARGGRAAGKVDVTGTFFPGAFERVEMSFPGNDPATGKPDPGFAHIVGLRSGGPGIIFVFVFELNLDTGKLTAR